MGEGEFLKTEQVTVKKLSKCNQNSIHTHPRSLTSPEQFTHGKSYIETRQNQIAQNQGEREILKRQRKETYYAWRNKDEDDNRLLNESNVRRQWNRISKVMKEKTV